MNKRIPFHAAITAGLALQILGLAPGVMRQCNADEMQVAPIALKTHTWVPLGGQFKLGVSAVTANESIIVNGVGSNGTRWSIESSDSGKTWGSPEDHNGNLLSAPACDTYSAPFQTKIYGKVSCFWVSDLHSLWGQLGDGTFVGGPSVMEATSAPSVFDFGGGEVYVFAHGANDDALWFASVRPGNGGKEGAWTSMGGQMQGQPGCLMTGSHHEGGAFTGKEVPDFSCYVLGSDGVVWAEHFVPGVVNYQNLTLSTSDQYVWDSIGGEALGGVNAFTAPSGTRLAVRGTDSALWIAHLESNEWKWQRYPGEISSVPSCALSYCFAILPDGQMGFLDLTGRL